MSDVGAVWVAMELFCSDFGGWLTVIIYSESRSPLFKCVRSEQLTPSILKAGYIINSNFENTYVNKMADNQCGHVQFIKFDHRWDSTNFQ